MYERIGLILMAVATAMLLAVPAQAGLLLYEGNDYGMGESLVGPDDWVPAGGKDGGTGWAEPWQGNVGRSPEVAAGLTYPDLPAVGGAGYRTSRVESERKVGQAVMDEWKPNNTVWFSVLMDPDEAKGDLSVRFYTTYSQGSVPWYYNRGIGFNLDSSGSIVQASMGGARGTAVLATPGATNLILGKIETGDEVSADLIETTLTVWANPVIADGEPTTGGSVLVKNMGVGYEAEVDEYFGARGGGSWGGSIDEIRLGTDFDSVVVPEPMTMALLGLGGVSLLARRRRR